MLSSCITRHSTTADSEHTGSGGEVMIFDTTVLWDTEQIEDSKVFNAKQTATASLLNAVLFEKKTQLFHEKQSKCG
jgi:hypothetical protein